MFVFKDKSVSFMFTNVLAKVALAFAQYIRLQHFQDCIHQKKHLLSLFCWAILFGFKFLILGFLKRYRIDLTTEPLQ